LNRTKLWLLTLGVIDYKIRLLSERVKMAGGEQTAEPLRRAQREIEEASIDIIAHITPGRDRAVAAVALEDGRNDADQYIADRLEVPMRLVLHPDAKAQLLALKGLHEVLALYAGQLDKGPNVAQFLGFLGRSKTAASVEMESELVTAFGRVVRNETGAFSSDVSALIDLFYPIWRIRWTGGADDLEAPIE
jgi:hypothetical protein